MGPDHSSVPNGTVWRIGVEKQENRICLWLIDCAAYLSEMRLLIGSGVPLKESVFKFGTFVMSSVSEIEQVSGYIHV